MPHAFCVICAPYVFLPFFALPPVPTCAEISSNHPIRRAFFTFLPFLMQLSFGVQCCCLPMRSAPAPHCSSPVFPPGKRPFASIYNLDAVPLPTPMHYPIITHLPFRSVPLCLLFLFFSISSLTFLSLLMCAGLPWPALPSPGSCFAHTAPMHCPPISPFYSICAGLPWPALRVRRANALPTYHPCRTSMACPALPLCGLATTEAERALPDINVRIRASMVSARSGFGGCQQDF